MALLIVQVQVADYAKMRTMFDSFEAKRVAAGMTNARVYRHADKGNDLVILANVANVAKAREFMTSEEMRTEQQKGGIAGPPKIHFIE